MNRAAVALVLSVVATSAQQYITDKKPVLVHKTAVCYTEKARGAQIEGDVVLSAEIHTDGLAHSIRVTRSLEPGLDANAIEGVKQWRFRPGEQHGEATKVPVIIEVNFRLKDPTQRCLIPPQSGRDQKGKTGFRN